jgi:hypothetical protein
MTRGKNWTPEENLRLARAFVHVSHDAIDGTSRTSKMFYGEVQKTFEKLRTTAAAATVVVVVIDGVGDQGIEICVDGVVAKELQEPRVGTIHMAQIMDCFETPDAAVGHLRLAASKNRKLPCYNRNGFGFGCGAVEMLQPTLLIQCAQ